MTSVRNCFVLLLLLGHAVLLVSSVRAGDCIQDQLNMDEYEELLQVASYIAGNFTTEWQAQTIQSAANINTYVVRIWEQWQKGVWLYVEQNFEEWRELPFRQRVYHLSRAGTMIVHRSYVLEDAESIKGAWAHPEEFALKKRMIEYSGCDTYITRIDATTFKGSTKPGQCTAGLNGADYVMFTNKITPFRIIQIRSGHYANGTLMWEDPQPYEHVRIADPKKVQKKKEEALKSKQEEKLKADDSDSD